jgi:ADP-ribosyl-[dinitrogen reductase] hydrolase
MFFYFVDLPALPNIRQAVAAILAGACGDALGNGVEFAERGTFPQVLSMRDSQRYLPLGQWSDDTAMMLCVAESLLEHGRVDVKDQMERYLAFWDQQIGWDCQVPIFPGRTTAAALENFRRTRDPYSATLDPNALGNGALTRVLPLSIVLHGDEEELRNACIKTTSTTHAAELCVEASQVLGLIQSALLNGKGKDEALHAAKGIHWSNDRLNRIASGGYAGYPLEAISSSGYVLDSLEAALWCFLLPDTRDAVLTAVNLGGDCDTVACIVGQLCGLAYAGQDIPHDWQEQVKGKERLVRIGIELCELANRAAKTKG